VLPVTWVPGRRQRTKRAAMVTRAAATISVFPVLMRGKFNGAFDGLGGRCGWTKAACAASSPSSGHIPASVVVLAIGHSARDTYEMLLRRGVPMVQKPFQMGVRVEHPQEIVNRVKYGDTPLEQRLGAADYTLVASGKHDLFTFCMCAGGYVMPSVSEPGAFCTNRHEPVAPRLAVRQQRPGGHGAGGAVRRRRRIRRRAAAARVRVPGFRGRAEEIAVPSSACPTSSPGE